MWIESIYNHETWRKVWEMRRPSFEEMSSMRRRKEKVKSLFRTPDW